MEGKGKKQGQLGKISASKAIRAMAWGCGKGHRFPSPDYLSAEPGPRLRSGGFGGSSLVSSLSVPDYSHIPFNGVVLVRRKRLHWPLTIGQFRITKIHTWLPFLGFLFFFLPSVSEPV